VEITVELSDEVARRLEERVAISEFDSVEAYVSFVIQEVTAPRPEFSEEKADRDAEREEAVREQLESLGYLE
jgi:hypothetical protein